MSHVNEEKQPSPEPVDDGRACHGCGYALTGLPHDGNCPECGKPYTLQSSLRLQPWPSALVICGRLGWPVLGIVLMPAVAAMGLELAAVVIGYALILTVPVNSYVQVRRMLKRHLPHAKRTRGFILVLRAIGTTLCVIMFLATLAPLVLLGACLFLV